MDEVAGNRFSYPFAQPHLPELSLLLLPDEVLHIIPRESGSPLIEVADRLKRSNRIFGESVNGSPANQTSGDMIVTSVNSLLVPKAWLSIKGRCDDASIVTL
jgi:hypothetical protein